MYSSANVILACIVIILINTEGISRKISVINNFRSQFQGIKIALKLTIAVSILASIDSILVSII